MCAPQGKNTCGSGSNDPIMTGFTGRAFNFFGDVGKTYNLISSKNHQLSARLKLSVMSDHNGTTMDGVGFMYKSYRVLFELEGDQPHGASYSLMLPGCLMTNWPVALQSNSLIPMIDDCQHAPCSRCQDGCRSELSSAAARSVHDA